MKNKRILGVALLLVIVILLIIFYIRYEPVPTAETPSVQGLTPGISTTDDVVQIMGQPSEILECAVRAGEFDPLDRLRYSLDCKTPETIVYLYEVPTPVDEVTMEYEFHLHNGVVHHITENQIGVHSWYILFVTDELLDLLLPIEKIEQMYGDPQEIWWSRIAPSNQVMLYCDIGKMIHEGDFDGEQGQDYEAFAIVQVYFQPMKLRECKYEFYSDFSEEKDIFEGLLD